VPLSLASCSVLLFALSAVSLSRRASSHLFLSATFAALLPLFSLLQLRVHYI